MGLRNDRTTWLWLAWCVVLAGCPAALIYVMAAYAGVPSHPPPWNGPVDLIVGLCVAQTWVSIAAAIAPLAWERRWKVLLTAWLVIIAMRGATEVLRGFDMMSKTGAYF